MGDSNKMNQYKPDFLNQREYYTLTTNILHYLVHNNQTKRIEDPIQLTNQYLIEVEKPETVRHLFQLPTLNLMAFLLRYITNEIPNVQHYQRTTPSPNITIKQKPTKKALDYLIFLAKKRSYRIPDINLLSKEECSELIKTLR